MSILKSKKSYLPDKLTQKKKIAQSLWLPLIQIENKIYGETNVKSVICLRNNPPVK